MASSFINLGLLIILFPGYIAVATTPWVPTAAQAYGIKVGFVVVTVLINIVGFRWVSRISGIILAFLFTPFVAVVIYGFATGGIYALPWHRLADVPDWHTHMRIGAAGVLRFACACASSHAPAMVQAWPRLSAMWCGPLAASTPWAPSPAR